MPERPAWVEVDLSAVAHNARQLRARIGPSTLLCAVVKADGYGHGAIPVARAALDSGADCLAVAIVPEASELRAAGFAGRILVLGCAGRESALRAVDLGLDLTAASLEEARAFSAAAAALGLDAVLHLKIDTGMARLGVPWKEAAPFAEAVASLPRVRIEGVASHFASADAADLSFAREQLGRFLEAAVAIEARGVATGIKHIANSAAALALPESRLDMVRTGIALYGLAPSPATSGLAELRPAMRLVARVTALRELAMGDTVGYGRTWRAPRPSLIATLPLGYADGWTRLLAGRTSVAFGGRRAPIVGTICMDQFMVDATDIPGIRVGDEATLFGEGGPSADEIASALGTINYEIPCMIGGRVPRLYKESGIVKAGRC